MLCVIRLRSSNQRRKSRPRCIAGGIYPISHHILPHLLVFALRERWRPSRSHHTQSKRPRTMITPQPPWRRLHKFYRLLAVQASPSFPALPDTRPRCPSPPRPRTVKTLRRSGSLIRRRWLRAAFPLQRISGKKNSENRAGKTHLSRRPAALIILRCSCIWPSGNFWKKNSVKKNPGQPRSESECVLDGLDFTNRESRADIFD
jgi:hypothetical protein